MVISPQFQLISKSYMTPSDWIVYISGALISYDGQYDNSRSGLSLARIIENKQFYLREGRCQSRKQNKINFNSYICEILQ